MLMIAKVLNGVSVKLSCFECTKTSQMVISVGINTYIINSIVGYPDSLIHIN